MDRLYTAQDDPSAELREEYAHGESSHRQAFSFLKVMQSLPFRSEHDFAYRLSAEQRQILCERVYCNPRWTVRLQEGSLWIRRSSNVVLFCLPVTEAKDGFLLGPIRIYSSLEVADSSVWAEMAGELIEDALTQGRYFLREVRFAVMGDVHGQMDAMVGLLQRQEESLGQALDFVLQVGDFMPLRNPQDLESVYGPRRYRRLGDFGAYYLGQKQFPWPVYFIGGNHEPYGFLEEMEEQKSLDGYATLTRNVHYLGRAGWARPLGVEVMGLSAIFAESRYAKARPARADRRHCQDFAYFNEQDLLTLQEEYDNCLADWASRLDIMLCHDWPAGLLPERDLLAIDLKYSHLENLRYRRWAGDLLPPSAFLCCGHHHIRRHYQSAPSGKTSPEILCLADVAQGVRAVALFQKKEDQVKLIMPPRKSPSSISEQLISHAKAQRLHE